MNQDSDTDRPDVEAGTCPLEEAGLITRLIVRMTSRPWLTVACTVYALGLIFVLGAYLLSIDGVLDADGKAVTGDFLNFYIGGSIISTGRGESLYDNDVQHHVQDQLTGPDYVGWHAFGNPPLYAIVLSLTARFSFVHAFYMHGLLMIAAMVAALIMLKPVLPCLGRCWFTTVLVIVFFHPMIRTMIGGQNSALTFFLLAGIYASLRRERPVLAGVFLGLLSYKPQFLPMLFLLLLIRKEFRCIVAAMVTGIGHYLLGAVFCGFDWPLAMWRWLGEFQKFESGANFHSHISLLSACEFSLPDPWALPVAAALIIATAVVMLRCVRRHANTNPDFATYWALAITGAILISPHTQYYDVSLLVLPLTLAIDRQLQQGRFISLLLRLLLLAGYLGYTVYEVSKTLHFQPLILWPILTFIWLMGMNLRPEADDQFELSEGR